MADKPKTLFVPGQNAGPTFGGSGVSPATLKARAEAMKSQPTAGTSKVAAPTGEKVAKQYPWMASIRMNHGTALNSYTKFMRINGEPGFYNAQRRRIYIDEMRIFAAPSNYYPVGDPPDTADIELARHVAVKFSKQSTRYVDRWLPLWNINTVRNRINQWPKFNGVFKLPVEYYLQRGSVFSIKLRLDPQYSNIVFDMTFGLLGRDPVNGVPCSLLKPTSDMYGYPVDPTPVPRPIVFDENRDVPLNDCVIDVISLSVDDITPFMSELNPSSPSLVFPYCVLANTSLQFIPPEGPQWHTTDDWFPFQSLLWQPGLYMLWPLTHYYYQSNHMIHRPVTPYILEEREEFIVELQTIDAMNYIANGHQETTLPIYCTLFGRQEAL